MKFLLTLVFGFMLLWAPALAQKDAKGTQDHSVIGRFEGSVIVQGETKTFDERVIQSAKLADSDTALGSANSITRSGTLTNLVFDAPKNSSSIEIAANYRARLEALGYKAIFDCASSACTGFGPVNKVVRLTFGDNAWGSWSFRGGYGRNPRYMVMEMIDGDARSTVALLIGEAGIDGDPPRYALLVVDKASLKMDQITTPSPKSMNDAFDAQGRIALYGIYFDTGSSKVKSDSAPTLQAIADLMKQQPKLSLVVVGHTDNVGEFASNIALSQARAASVAASLTTDYKIDKSRLTPFGAGMAAPAASNASEAGRTKNRRVELVPR